MSRDRSRDNRLEALRKLRDARKPVKIHHSTGRALARDGLAVKCPNGYWKSTTAGVDEIDSVEREERRHQIDWNINEDQRKYGRRVIDWLELHSPLSPKGIHYARHVVNALLCGVPPIESGWKWEDGDYLIRCWVEAAIDGLEEMREAKRAAKAAGGDIVISYAAGPKIAARARDRRRAAVEAATVEQPADDNIVGLEDFRQRRLA